MRVIRGPKAENSALTFAFETAIINANNDTDKEIDGILFLGYPLLEGNTSSKNVDALFLSQKYGIVVFSFWDRESNIEEIKEIQDIQLSLIESKLKKQPMLNVRGKGLKITVNTATFSSKFLESKDDNGYLLFSQKTSFCSFLEELVPENNIDKEVFDLALSIIQAASRVRAGERRRDIQKNDSLAAKLQKIENQISLLDDSQNRAIVETRDGPQLIRGMAGTGKTIVLAAKAALLHTFFPNKRIAITFFSRSLYDIFKTLVNRFCLDMSGFEVNLEKVHILHCWGGKDIPGLYRKFCVENDVRFLPYGVAKNLDSDPFKGA